MSKTGSLTGQVDQGLSFNQVLSLELASRRLDLLESGWQATFATLDVVLDERLDVEIREDGGRMAIEANVDRSARAIARHRSGESLTLSNGETDPGSFRALVVSTLNSRAHDAPPLVSLSLKLPSKDFKKVRRVLTAVGGAMAADFGVFLPPTAYLVLCYQLGRLSFAPTMPETEISPIPNIGIPAGRTIAHTFRNGAPLPPYVGWLNYWGPATAAALGFSGVVPMKLGESVEAMPGGAWLVQLADDPLDLTRSEHRRVLSAAYARFGAIGASDVAEKLSGEGEA